MLPFFPRPTFLSPSFSCSSPWFSQAGQATTTTNTTHKLCFPLQRSHLLFFLFLLSLRKTMYSMDQPEKLVHLKEEAAKFSKEVSKRLRSGHPNSNEGPKLPRSQDIDTWWCSPTSRTNLLSHTLCSLSLTLSLTHRRSFQRVLHIRQVFFPFSILTFLIISVSIFSSQ